jgi:hypothetical protein
MTLIPCAFIGKHLCFSDDGRHRALPPGGADPQPPEAISPQATSAASAAARIPPRVFASRDLRRLSSTHTSYTHGGIWRRWLVVSEVDLRTLAAAQPHGAVVVNVREPQENLA